MNWNCGGLHWNGRRRLTRSVATGVLGVAVMLGFCGLDARGQAATPPAKPGTTVQTFYLANISQQTEGIEIVTAVRNILTPDAKVYFVSSQNALIVNTTPDQLLLVQKLLSDLDRPRKTYRLTYTITETDGGKRIGTQHFVMVVVSGQRTVLKQGSRVPIATGSYTTTGSSGAQQTQFTYLDIGMNFDATLEESANGVRLRTKAEQSSIADEKSGLGVQDPLVRQTLLEGTSILTPGKPLALGSVDVPGSTRHLDIEVVIEVVR